MSFIEFKQSENRLLGFSAYEADPDWEIGPIDERGGLIAPLTKTGEGSGFWFVYDPANNLWGSIVRSGDSPYNDCLPPSEFLLKESFDDHDSATDILKNLKTRVEADFFNPFRVLVGSLNNQKLFMFHGSFQSSVTELEPGYYHLADNETPKSPDSDVDFQLDENDPDFAALKKRLDPNRFKEENDHLLANDGMRTLSSVLVFEATHRTFRSAYAALNTEEPEFTDQRFELQVNSS